MKVLYDHQMFSLQKYGGITKYFCEFIKLLPKDIETEIALIFSYNAHLNENKKLIGKKYLEFPDRRFPGKNFLANKLINFNQYYSETKIRNNNFDLFHPTFYDPYFLSTLKKPFILTIHDLIEFKFKTKYGAENPIHNNMENLIKKADRLIAISNNTKKDIVEIFGISDDKIDVIYHGFNFPGEKKGDKQKERYLLFVGARGGYKNFKFFLKAISPLLHRENDLKLICVGKDFEKSELEYIASFGLTERVMAKHVSERGLNQLYSDAIAFVFPSLYEGFGMPILEAFANNCPVCLSNTSSFPEVADNAGLYFDPYNEDSIFTIVESIVCDSQKREKMIKMGNERLQHFSWSKTSSETALSYQKVI